MNHQISDSEILEYSNHAIQNYKREKHQKLQMCLLESITIILAVSVILKITNIILKEIFESISLELTFLSIYITVVIILFAFLYFFYKKHIIQKEINEKYKKHFIIQEYIDDINLTIENISNLSKNEQKKLPKEETLLDLLHFIKEDSLYALQLEVIDRKEINNKYKENIQACLTSEDYFKEITNQTNIKRDEIKELFTNWRKIREMINYLN